MTRRPPRPPVPGGSRAGGTSAQVEGADGIGKGRRVGFPLGVEARNSAEDGKCHDEEAVFFHVSKREKGEKLVVFSPFVRLALGKYPGIRLKFRPDGQDLQGWLAAGRRPSARRRFL